MDIKIINSKKEVLLPDTLPEYGKLFTNHMFLMDYENEQWSNPRIIPLEHLNLHPASTVFHYGSAIFEGLKAYKGQDGTIQLFRPMDNINRLNHSAERLQLPTIPPDTLLDILIKFVKTEADWVPSGKGEALYLRPFLIGTDPCVTVVNNITKALFVIIASPSGAYYKEDGLQATKIYIEETDVRAVRGGTGSCKCGGNYAAQIRASHSAEQNGYSQVLWLDGVERKYIEEVGAMNIMFKMGDKIVTPELNGSILDGVTRKSCIELLRARGYTVEERKIAVGELIEKLEKNEVEEAWGTGTAVVIVPISHFGYKKKEYQVGNGITGELSSSLYEELYGIQRGIIEDKFSWNVKI